MNWEKSPKPAHGDLINGYLNIGDFLLDFLLSNPDHQGDFVVQRIAELFLRLRFFELQEFRFDVLLPQQVSEGEFLSSQVFSDRAD